MDEKTPLDRETIEAIDSLTGPQLESLRLARILSDKEQAIELGISPSGVEQRLARVRQRLGVRSTREAIRLFNQYEDQGCGKTTCGPPELDHSPKTGSFEPSEHSQDGSGDRLRDSAPTAQFRIPSQTVLASLAGKRVPRHDLTVRQKLQWIGIGVVALILAGFFLLAAFESLSRTLSGL